MMVLKILGEEKAPEENAPKTQKKIRAAHAKEKQRI
jgi:hypothetical protein